MEHNPATEIQNSVTMDPFRFLSASFEFPPHPTPPLRLTHPTYVCDQKLFTIIKTGNLGFTLRHKVVLFDVFLEQQFIYRTQDDNSNDIW